MGKRDEIWRRYKQKKSLFAAALGAIFLCAGIVFGVQHIGGSELQVDTLFTPSPTSFAGVLSAQIHSTEQVGPEAPELMFVGNTSLAATIPPMTVTPQVLGAIIGEGGVDIRQSNEIIHYIVEEGDSIESVAEQFEISVNTIVWANELRPSSSISPGEEVIILPVSGALHLVRPADTLSEIAVWYRGDVEEILRFNGLDSAESIFVGDILIIPGGRKPAVVPNGRLTPIANSYFIYPVPRSFKLTQGIHPFNAVDLANGACGGPVYAAAGGTVQRAGYHNAAGNYVRVLHPNGVVTLYGHLSGQTVSPGERVLQGEIIGYIGHSGYTIPAGAAGCHLHFEVRGATNPFAR